MNNSRQLSTVFWLIILGIVFLDVYGICKMQASYPPSSFPHSIEGRMIHLTSLCLAFLSTAVCAAWRSKITFLACIGPMVHIFCFYTFPVF
jgi:hypothetical protein